jgi:hypothetical protein
MSTTLSPPGQSLQTIFEHALSQLRLGAPNLTEAPKDTTNYLEALHNNILEAKLMTNNVILYNMYCMGEALAYNKEKPNKHVKFQITSDFLLEGARLQPAVERHPPRPLLQRLPVLALQVRVGKRQRPAAAQQDSSDRKSKNTLLLFH